MERFAEQIPEIVWKCLGFGLGALLTWSYLTAEHKQENLVPKRSYAHMSEKAAPFLIPELQQPEKRMPAAALALLAQEEKEASEIPANLLPAPQRNKNASNRQPPSSGGVKVAKQLVWTHVKTAQYYGVQLSRDMDFSNSKTYFTQRNHYPFELYPERKYHWRVRAYNGAKEPLSEYSKVYSFQLQKRAPAESKAIEEEKLDEEILEMEL